MSEFAFCPCFVCGKRLRNEFPDISDNQPSEGTEFRTYGHYGSTFWDSFDGEELVLNICDECLAMGKDRLAQQKRYIPIYTEYAGIVGQRAVDRPMVPFTGNPDDTKITVEIEELGTANRGVTWRDDIDAVKQWLLGGRR